ncbi:MAG: AAA family ATPase [Acidobacteriia bacterium]|nr:AAA family ATPase [Terriglobia bacterium]
MYLNFFGLKEQPFGVTPDPRFLYLSEAHKEALASLYYGIEANRGFIGLIAQPGMGKTTMLFHLLETFRTSARVAFLFQTHCNSREFMRLLLAELGSEEDTQDLVRMYDEFNKCLLQIAQAGHRLIVVVDEAQNLEPEVLETLRLLSNFETSQAKLMHIILAGQPALAQKLASPRLAQLRQRVSIVQGLAPLSHGEVKNYVEHRLRIAGYKGAAIFTDEAYKAIAVTTEGIPRNVNNFCFNALSLACALRKRTVDSDVVNEVMSDLDIQRLTWGLPSESLESPFSRTPDAADVPAEVENYKEISNAADAAAYMQQVSLKLRNWRESLQRSAGGVRPAPSASK